MGKIKITMSAPVDDEGNVDESQVAPREVTGGGGQLSYAPVQAGFYPAIVTKLAEKVYQAGYGSHKNPDSANGKWDYYGATPTVHIPHYSQAVTSEEVTVDGETVLKETTENVLDYTSVINRQDLTVGVIKNGRPYRVPQDGKSPLFRGNSGAYDMLQALALFQIEGTNVVVNEDLEDVRNRVVWVGTKYAAYAKRANDTTLNWDVDEFATWLKDEAIAEAEGISPEAMEAWNEWAGLKDPAKEIYKFPIEHIFEIVDAYNKAHEDEWGKVDDGYGIRIKSFITYWGAMSQEDAEKYGFYYDEPTKRVFASRDDYITAKGLAQLQNTSSEVEML